MCVYENCFQTQAQILNVHFIADLTIFPTIVVPTARCPDHTFTCDNGECVTKLNPECDFVTDCADGSDEARCGE